MAALIRPYATRIGNSQRLERGRAQGSLGHGGKADIEAHAKGPLLNPVEMGMPDSAAVLAHLRESRSYVAAFRAAFPGEAERIAFPQQPK